MGTLSQPRGEINSLLPDISPAPKAANVGGESRKHSSGVFAPAKSSWRERARSHYQNILDLLRVRGPAGVLSSELYDSPEKFGRSPRNRISEARAKGFQIQTVNVNASTVRYVLLADRSVQLATQSDDWYTRETGRPRAAVVPEESTTDDLPLFAGVG